MEENPNIEFISYTGEYPNLCTGYLTIKINGQLRRLPEEDSICPSIIMSTGSCVEIDGDYHVQRGKWKLLKDYLPKDLKKYSKKIEELVNENVEWGCCGGCI